MSTSTSGNVGAESGRRVVRAAIWLPGLAVAVGAAVATAHGLYEVALAARVPGPIAWLYPLITDGLALVAYAATARLSGSAARYAWAVVVLAAGLSGLAQAMYLASDPAPAPVGAPAPVEGAAVGPVFVASAVLRFGVGAWPAVAAAIVAHLLYLLATDTHERVRPDAAPEPAPSAAVQPEPYSPPVQLAPVVVQPAAVHSAPSVQPDAQAAVQPPAGLARPADRPALAPAPVEQHAAPAGTSPARDRARAAATRHAHRHGALPTVSELETAAAVSRGTAAAALKHLRAQPTPLHLITSTDHAEQTEQHDDPTIEKATQP